MRPPTTQPSLLCWRCRHRLLYPEEETQHTLVLTRLLRLMPDGTLWMKCITRGCGAWCVVPAKVRAIVAAALGHLPDTVECAHD
jgi:hypothetical protein